MQKTGQPPLQNCSQPFLERCANFAKARQNEATHTLRCGGSQNLQLWLVQVSKLA